MDANVNTPLGEGNDNAAPQDQNIFLTPPGEESSLPTSDEAMGFVAGLLTDPDSGLGFVPGAQSLQGNDTALVSEISKLGFDKCPVSQKDSSSEDGSGKVREGMENREGKLLPENPCNFGADPQPQQNEQISVSGGNVGTLAAKSEIANGAGNSSKQCDGNGESSERVCEAAKEAAKSENANGAGNLSEQCDGNGESSERVSEAAKEAQSTTPAEHLPSETPRPRENVTVFDALEALRRNSDEPEDSVPNMNLVELAKSRGMTFPRPRWWPGNGFMRE